MTDALLPDTPKVTACANVLRVLGHPVRLSIALLLQGQGPQTVSGIEARLGLKQPNLSQHLAILRDAQIVESSRAAKSVTYTLAAGPAVPVLQALTRDPAATPAPDTAIPARAGMRTDGDALVFATVHFPNASEAR
ncbi:Transcriptional regulator, ArsR family [plant metagenome]|uniref:Transcriptional regulator, ArsR family n=1 Tax=plant metagenome TaxID=1297885 RepID=A0A484P576_9ZZZZ